LHNTRRLHSTLGCLSQVQYEGLHHNTDRQEAESTAAICPSNRIKPDAHGEMIQTFPPELTEFQGFVLGALGVPDDRHR